MTLDKASMTASATISEIDGTADDIALGNHGVGVFATQAISQSIWEGITKLRVRNDVYNSGDNRGIDIDNILITGNTATDFNWRGGSGDWNQAANWTPGGSPGNGMATLSDETVLFGGASGATSTIFTDSQVNINQIQFANETASYFIVGPGGVNMITTIEDTPVAPSVKVLAGDHTFQTPFSIGDDTTITVDSGSLAFDGQVDLAGHTLTLSGTTSFNHSVVDSVGGGSVVILSGEVSGLGAISVVPEPASLVLVLLAGVLGLVGGRNRKKAKCEMRLMVKKIACAVVTVVVMFIAVPASAVTLWEETFEAYAAGTEILSATGWENSSPAPDGPTLINGYHESSEDGHRLLGSGMALDGNSHLPQGWPARLWSTSRATVPGPTANAEAADYSVSFDAIVERNGNSNGTGNSTFYLDYTCGCDVDADGMDDARIAEFGLHFSRSNNYGWGFVNSGPGLSGTTQYTGGSANLTPPADGIGHAVNNPTTASITLDKATMMASATVGGYDFDPQPFTQAVWDGIHGLKLDNDIDLRTNVNDRNYGMDVDNIRITATTPTDFTWSGGSGDWGQSENWTPGGNPGNGWSTLDNDTVAFGDTGGVNSTVFTNLPIELNQLDFDSASAGYFIAGPGGVSMITTTEDTPVAPAVGVASGDHAFQTPFSIGADTTVTITTGSLAFDNAVDVAGNMLTLSGTTSLNHSVVDTGEGGSIFGSGTLGTEGDTTIGANLSLDGATLAIDVRDNSTGQTSDQFDVVGSTTLNGDITVDVNLPGGYTPSSDVAILTTTEGIVDNSASLSLAGAGAGSFTGVSVVGNNLMLLVGGSTSVPGDYNGNGSVDAADYTVWRDSFGDTVPRGTGADGVNDTKIDNLDYIFWKVKFANAGSGSGSGAAVPEPSSLALVLLAGFFGMVRIKNRR
jgi:hypothetical protein